MSGTQLNTCLVVLLVAVSVQYSYGVKYNDDCTTTSECDYDHGYCYKFDQCDKGTCVCEHGYSREHGNCLPMKKIGESCTDDTAACYHGGHCTDDVCTCEGILKHKASENKMHCGRLYGESCDTDNDCYYAMTCQNKECGCTSGKKKYTATLPYGETFTFCIDSDVNVDVKENGDCTDKNLCESGLMCVSCPGKHNENKCMSGASQLSVSVLALCCLFLTAMLTKVH